MRAAASAGPPTGRTATKNGATNAVSRWLPRPRPTSSPPSARSRSRRSSAHTSDRWMSSATSARWSGLTSATTADDQTVRDGPGRERGQGRQPPADAEPLPDRRQRPQRDRDADGRQQVRPPGDRAERQQLEQRRRAGCRSGSRWGGRCRGRGARSASRPSRRTPCPASASRRTGRGPPPRRRWPARAGRRTGPRAASGSSSEGGIRGSVPGAAIRGSSGSAVSRPSPRRPATPPRSPGGVAPWPRRRRSVRRAAPRPRRRSPTGARPAPRRRSVPPG